MPAVAIDVGPPTKHIEGLRNLFRSLSVTRKETMFKTTLTFVKVTKGTVVFGNEDDGAPIRMLYISKSTFPGGETNYPAMIEVEVKAVA